MERTATLFEMGLRATASPLLGSVTQAINRQIAHYSYHVGQIVYVARQFAGSNWRTLTIPKKKSGEFNAQVASGEKSQR
ncbi:MAG: hypothetical protein QOG55_17 [Acidobacteriaceae bacterium]|jgi:hypothetical protein|nr:hypothetical protein [Acidobacteriaceae bacterium]